MSFEYFNPFASPQASRSTFNAMSSGEGHLLLFGGMPADVTEYDLHGLLVSQEYRLPASTTRVTICHDSTGQSLGYAIVSIGNEVDAERIRRNISGQTIDGSRIRVHHILPPTSVLPERQVENFLPPQSQPKSQQNQNQAQNQNQQQSQNQNQNQQRKLDPKGKTKEVPKSGPGGKPVGLQLLARMSKSGGTVEKNKQAALLAKQKANIKSSSPGTALLARLAKPARTGKSLPGAGGGKGGVNTSGTAKVQRAKQQANKMDVDQPMKKSQPGQGQGKGQVVNGSGAGAGGGKPKAKTQAELDEEMRLYERARKFA